MDDLPGFTDNNSEHELHLGEVLYLLHGNSLIMHRDKCTVAAPHRQWTSSAIGSAQVTYAHSNTKWKQYKITLSKLRYMRYRHLGVVNYYHSLFPMAADHMALTMTWGTEHQSVFINTKCLLSEAQPGAPLVLTTDASNNAIGPVINTIPVTIAPFTENC